MPSLRDIKKRIASIKSTGKITKAMKMVSAAKLRKTQNAMTQARPYAQKIKEILSNISSGVEEGAHPLLTAREIKKIEVLVITSDRGLCGAFNTNVLKKAVLFIKEQEKNGIEVSITTIGKKARDHFKRRKIPIRQSVVDITSSPNIYDKAKDIALGIIELYSNGTIDASSVVFNEFKNVVTQIPTAANMLPIEKIGTEEQSQPKDFIFEPTELEILNDLLPKYVEIQIFRAILESRTSEEAARMVAMENATKNTNELIDKLTLQYNKARQASITAELMDIVGGAAAIEA
ncbi:MAG: ATP synthase F1 subunit gamma [Nitrospirae bacterium]|nr:ATP synthase F1 subunit gamma [Nitrospirota bacterium]MBF0541582.1 ATP synthase F1 subunit gamma [Nitrospirota bacterium]